MDDQFVRDTCKMGQGELCCRYLAMDREGWECLKLTTMKSLLDVRVATNSMNAQGDNCEGVPNGKL